MTNPKSEANLMKVAVWFDRPRDSLCFADRLDAEREYTAKDGSTKKFKPGDPIPDEFVVRIPLLYGEEAMEAIFQAASEGSDFCKIMDGVQRLLDKRVVNAIEIAENLRAELSKRSGGGAVGWMRNQVTVKADEFLRKTELHQKLVALFEKARVMAEQDAPGRLIGDELIQGIGDLKEWMMENRLYGPGQVPGAQA